MESGYDLGVEENPMTMTAAPTIPPPPTSALSPFDVCKMEPVDSVKRQHRAQLLGGYNVTMSEIPALEKEWTDILKSETRMVGGKTMQAISWKPHIVVGNSPWGGYMMYRGVWNCRVGVLTDNNILLTVDLPYAVVEWRTHSDSQTPDPEQVVANSMSSVADHVNPGSVQHMDRLFALRDNTKHDELRTRYILSLVEYYKGGGGGDRQITKGTKVRVTRGRKVPKGTEGVVIWLGSSTYMGKTVVRCGVKDAAGKVHWTATTNLDTIGTPMSEVEAVLEAKAAYLQSGGEWIFGPVRN